MKLVEVKKLRENQGVKVNLGYKFCGSIAYAHFIKTEVVPSCYGDIELCLVKPFIVENDKCGWAAHTIGANMLVDAKQILCII